MKTNTPNKLNTYEIMGRKLRINFNETYTEATEEQDASYSYDTACVDKLASRDKIIEAIMQTKYPTFGSELAAIQNGGACAEKHQAFRKLAKELADGYLAEYF